ncbi:DUF397 domain-containing protein [Streptomyces sp.]|uniref:DUF397 domain-containing protein n=1 Tax=Streptomyces sp. TaxID=1931 RepID=UPI002D60B084|nr:DUF397 domain-containing protein [Streptomyces sp.]HZF89953.1 DUF397 domain-containing protein [Streptomyces sp.]
MTTPDIWRKSSYSGGGQGDACVEIAHRPTHISIRDSKTPTSPHLTFAAETFSTFLQALKVPPQA